jgi:glycine oxidase
MSDVVVVGGGLIGLGIAWRAAQRNMSVTVVDPSPGGAASWAAAGMLAPVTEVHYGEQTLLELNLESAGRYPAFVEELHDVTGVDSGYRQCGTLAIAFDGDDAAVLADLHAYQQRLGLASERLTASECRQLEPLLAPNIRSGLLVHGDHQVDNRRLAPALLAAGKGAGVDFVATTARSITSASGHVTGVELADDRQLDCDQVVLAAGCWSNKLSGLPPEAVPPVRPVKGQIIRLRAPADPPFLSRNVRCLVSGGQIYIVPRADGEIVAGATVEEQGFDTTVTAGAVHTLLRDAWTVLPAVAELELVETHAGLRPGSPDNLPMLGNAPGIDGLVVATGHYRNGVLLTPVTSDSIAELLDTGTAPEIVKPFSPGRFGCA